MCLQLKSKVRVRRAGVGGKAEEKDAQSRLWTWTKVIFNKLKYNLKLLKTFKKKTNLLHRLWYVYKYVTNELLRYCFDMYVVAKTGECLIYLLFIFIFLQQVLDTQEFLDQAEAHGLLERDDLIQGYPPAECT